MAVMSVAELKEIQERPAMMDTEIVSSAQLLDLREKYAGLVGGPLLEALIKKEFPGEIAIVSSFGAESAVLLHMVADIDPTVPVIFLNTGKLFGETLRYRDRLQEKLGLTDLRAIGPLPSDLEAQDPHGGLWNQDQDACCFVRKVLPLERALAPFKASITGRKRFQTSTRTTMDPIEEEAVRDVDGVRHQGATRFKINPLSFWGEDELNQYLLDNKLPKHPLVKDGYRSIGCMPCTDRVPEGGDYRDGRWKGSDKDECGIHLPINMDGDGI
jgi:phosphoadenosine phosphosulfate reductase